MSCKKILLSFVLLLAGSSVFAQALPVGVSPVFAPTVTSTGISYSGGVASSANAASLTFSNAANGPVYARTSAKIALGGGATADIALASAPTGSAIAGALGRFMGKTLPILATGIALYDLAHELGFDLSSSGGQLVVSKPDPLVCSVGPCYRFQNPYVDVPTWQTSLQSACSTQVTLYGLPIVSAVASGASSCTFSNGSDVRTFDIVRQSVEPVPAAPVPSTAQEFADAIAAKSGWPATSAINRAINDAIASGETIPLPQPSQITGPASVPLSPKVVQNPDGTTTTTTPSKSITYGPNTVNVTNNTTSIVTNAAGQPVATTATAAPADMPETCGYPGGPPCKIDETGTPEKAAEKVYNPLADAVKASKDSGTDKMAGTSDKSGLFSGWTMFWSAPAVVQCAPYQLPNWNGQSMGALDPCGVVDGVRTIMAYIWSLAGLFMCLGFVRESIQQG